MMLHPGIMMLVIWITAIVIYSALPFRLVNREFSQYGIVVLLSFVAVFVAGSFLVAKTKNAYVYSAARRVDFRFDLFLKVVCLVALAAGTYEVLTTNLDLEASYISRDHKANALLKGEASTSSLMFQILFVTYPAAYVYIARNIIFSESIGKISLLVFGILPVVATTLAMGGRSPLLYALCIGLFSFFARRRLWKHFLMSDQRSMGKKLFYAFSSVAVISISFYYFTAVFLVRAEASAGGVTQMFTVAETVWGVGFDGVGSGILFELLGENVVYLLFMFSWYFIQGLVMASSIFSNYEGPAQLGIYGLDLVSALMRRIDGELVASNFQSLMELGTYGFFPSAFGSLYVDFKFYGLIVCLVWGYLAGLVYQRVMTNYDARWYILLPFLIAGILFSLINTPLGFANGLVTHFWVAVMFVFSKDITRSA